MNGNPRSLDDLRREIDEIDCQIHTLIKKRGALAGEVAAFKRHEGLDKIRPGREAMLMRRLIGRHDGGFPAGAVVRIWRELISSLVVMEMPDYSVAVYAAEEDQGYWDLARDQFGSRTPMTRHSSTRDTLSQVFDGNAALAVLPYPAEDEPGSWWQNLCVPNAPQVLYRLPFFGHGNARKGKGVALDALALGKMKTEETGDDRTVIVLETNGDFSRTKLKAIFKDSGFRLIFMASSVFGSHLYYLEINGYVGAEDLNLQKLEENDAIERVTIIGNYATPIGEPGNTRGEI